MGLNPNSWGPQGWHFLHAIAFTFPESPNEDQRVQYQNYFHSLAHVLPCELCRENFKKKLIHTPPPMDNGTNMFKWTVDLHNEVNKANGKPELSYDQAFEEFKKNSKPGKTESNYDAATRYLTCSAVGLTLGGLLAGKKGIVIIGGIASAIGIGLILSNSPAQNGSNSAVNN